MKSVPEGKSTEDQDPLSRTEDAIESIGGLVSVLSYVHVVASAEDAEALRDPIGHLINAVQGEVHRARTGYEGIYRERWRKLAEAAGKRVRNRRRT